MPWYPPWNWVSSSSVPCSRAARSSASGFICGFYELYPGGLEDLGGILAAPDGDQCIGLAVHKELSRLDPGSSLGLGRRVWDDGVIPIFPEQEIGRAGQDDAHVLFIFIQWDCDLHELPPP